MPIQELIGFVGLAKQSAKGSAAGSPTYGFGVTDGKVFDLPVDQDYPPLTGGGGTNDRIAPQAVRTAVHPGAGFTTRLYPRSFPLLAYGALGTLGSAGTSPAVHTASPGVDLPYLTLFGRQGAEYVRLPDCKVDELSVSWSERDPLEVAATLLGLTPALHGSSWTPTNDESVQTFLGPVGGTFQLDTDSSTPATAKVTAATITVANNLAEQITSASILPADLVTGQQVIDGTFTLMPDDFSDFLGALTGTGTGTGISEAAVNGSFSMKVALDANTDVTFAASRVPMLAEWPDASPDGGPATIDLAFTVVRATSGDSFTIVIRNATASY